MKEKWKVYIKGVPGRGDEVIKTLTDLGAVNHFGYAGSTANSIYYIGHNGYIRCMFYDDDFVQTFMDDYREIKLSDSYDGETSKIIRDYYKEYILPEYEFKDGDILKNKEYNNFVVYKRNYEIYDTGILIYLFVNENSCDVGSSLYVLGTDYRLATPEEIEQFHKLLHKHDKDWDAKKKCIVNLKWKPAVNDWYWVVTSDGKVNKFLWFNSKNNNRFFNFGNCFKTKEEAYTAAKKIKDLLRGE